MENGQLVVFWLMASLLAIFPGQSVAGLYHRDVLLAPDLTSDGTAIAPDFDSFLALLTSVKKANDPETREGKEVKLRLDRLREKQGTDLTPAERVALAAELLRRSVSPGPTAQADVQEAMNLLTPFKRQPPDGLEFLVYTLLAEGFFRDGATQNEASSNASAALLDYEFPKELAGLTPAQRTWYRQLESRYYIPFLRGRAEDARSSPGRQVNTIDPLFPAQKSGGAKTAPFSADKEGFQAGAVTESEKAKLPGDAIAIVQQLILWHPTDGRLWWLLGELYNTAGDTRSAERALKVCKEDEVKYTNPVIRERFHALEAFNEISREVDGGLRFANSLMSSEFQRLDAVEEWRRKLYVGIPLGIVLAAVAYWQAREMARRFRARHLRAASRA